MKNTVLAISLFSLTLLGCNKLESSGGDDVCSDAASHIGECMGEDFPFNQTGCDVEMAEYMLTLNCDEVRYGPEGLANADSRGRGEGEKEDDKGTECWTDWGCDGSSQTKTCRPAGDGYQRCLPKARLGRLCEVHGFTNWGASDCADQNAVCERVPGMKEIYDIGNNKTASGSKEGICRLPVPEL